MGDVPTIPHRRDGTSVAAIIGKDMEMFGVIKMDGGTSFKI